MRQSKRNSLLVHRIGVLRVASRQEEHLEGDVGSCCERVEKRDPEGRGDRISVSRAMRGGRHGDSIVLGACAGSRSTPQSVDSLGRPVRPGVVRSLAAALPQVDSATEYVALATEEGTPGCWTSSHRKRVSTSCRRGEVSSGSSTEPAEAARSAGAGLLFTSPRARRHALAADGEPPVRAACLPRFAEGGAVTERSKGRAALRPF